MASSVLLLSSDGVSNEDVVDIAAIDNWIESPPSSQVVMKRRRRNAQLTKSSCTLAILTIMSSLLGILVGILLMLSALNKCHSITDQINTTSIPITYTSINCTWKDIRLPTTISPIKYNLLIQPNLTTFVSTGRVVIDLFVHNRTSLIVLHAEELNLTSMTITTDDIELTSEWLSCSQVGQWHFMLSHPIASGERVQITIDFVGSVNNAMAGLYRNIHLLNNGDMSYSAVTQFEPTFARKMFPCFDEPQYKAIYQVSIVRERQHISRANMHLIDTIDVDNNLQMDRFEVSVKMSTYLVAIAVLDRYANISRYTNNTHQPIEVSIFAPLDVIGNRGEFALDTTIKALEYLETFFKIPFPLNKQDLVALDDFSEGAMENFGLITFRDTMLLYDEDSSTTKAKETIAKVVCHELAHQWFGNLVTMKWWNDLWLNEGFANLMEYLVTDNIYPSWKLLDQFYVDNFVPGLYLDGLTTSHPISVNVHDPGEISSIFDAISYQKGSSIIRMIMGLSETAAFQLGLQQYIDQYKYQNAEGADLWAVLQKHVASLGNMSLGDVARLWTEQIGHPMLQIAIENNGTQLVIMNQQRFLYLQSMRTDDRMTNQWPIPIQYRTDVNPQLTIAWIHTNERMIIELGQQCQWLIANADSLGFYRVLYDDKSYEMIAKQLQIDHTSFSTVDRSVILYDAFSFVTAGYLNISTLMNLLQYLETGKENDRAPWTIVIGQLKNIEMHIIETDMFTIFQNYERKLAAREYAKYKWNQSESHIGRQLQSEILSFACRLDISDCVQIASNQFRQWIIDKNSVHADNLQLVISEGIKHGNTSDWEYVFNQYLHSQIPSEKNVLLAALACTNNVHLINRYLRYCLDRNIIKPTIMPLAIAMIVANPLGTLNAWRFIRNHWNEIETSFGETTMIGTLVKAVIQDFSTDFDYTEAREFFKNKHLGANRPRIEQALESVQINVQWRRLNDQPLRQWLQKWNASL